ncbi:hypothetical protein VQL36_07180 [Chengkuizengella sp. SCS-71B]
MSGHSSATGAGIVLVLFILLVIILISSGRSSSYDLIDINMLKGRAQGII